MLQKRKYINCDVEYVRVMEVTVIIISMILLMIKMVAVNMTMAINDGQAVRCEESSLKMFITNNFIVPTSLIYRLRRSSMLESSSPCAALTSTADILFSSGLDRWATIKMGTDLIFVIDITDYIRGEKSVMWRNFRFL